MAGIVCGGHGCGMRRVIDGVEKARLVEIVTSSYITRIMDFLPMNELFVLSEMTGY